MARLISADKLLELYDMGKEFEGYASALSVPIPVIRQNINDMPTVDAVPVVRCRDCKWYAPNNDGLWVGCAIAINCKEDEPEAVDFCSYGERKDNEM